MMVRLSGVTTSMFERSWGSSSGNSITIPSSVGVTVVPSGNVFSSSFDFSDMSQEIYRTRITPLGKSSLSNGYMQSS